MLIEVDVDPNKEAEFRTMLRTHTINIQGYDPKGPAGGCPNFTIVCFTRIQAMAVVDFMFNEGGVVGLNTDG